MTERPGGSDVQNTETVATYSPLPQKSSQQGRIDEGDYLISGFKFFSSATDANIAFILAKTNSGILSLYLAPLRKTITDQSGTDKQVTNGVRIHRLKNKMGTKELPTAELELTNTRAHLVGPLDRGIATVTNLLNVSRSHNFITSASLWRRAMAIAKSFAKARTSIDQPLWLFPMHLRMLAEMEVKHRGLMQLNFFTTCLISFAENSFPGELPRGYAPLPREGEEATVVLRALTATAKAVICKVSLGALQECQEGTTNVLASETVRHLCNKGNLAIFDGWMARSLGAIENEEIRQGLSAAWAILLQRLACGKERLEVVLGEGREIMFSLAWIVSGMLLSHDTQRDGNDEAREASRRWVLHGEGGVGEWVLADVIAAARKHARVLILDNRVDWDCKLVWGFSVPKGAATGYRVAVKASVDSSNDNSQLPS